MLSLVLKSSGRMYDYSSRVISLKFSSGENGFEEAVAVVHMPLARAFYMYESEDVLDVYIDDLVAGIAFEGRLVAPTVTADGVSLRTLGHFVALGDMPYTAFWSDDDYQKWFQPNTVLSGSTPVANSARYLANNRDRLYLALKEGTLYGPGIIGYWVYRIPWGSGNNIQRVEFDWEHYLDSPFRVIVNSLDEDLVIQQLEYNDNGTGAVDTGSTSVAISPSTAAIGIGVQATSAATNTEEDGARYAIFTNVRVTYTTDGIVYADDILAGIVDDVNTLNPDRLDDAISLIDSPALDISQAVYEDANAAAVANSLAALGDSSGDVYEVGIFEGKQVYLRPRGSVGRTWYVNAFDLQIERDDSVLINSAYAVYGADNYRTDVSDDDTSIGAYGYTRRAAIRVNSESQTEAETQRDLALADGATIRPRAGIKIDRVFSESGVLMPSWLVRSGDTVVIRNLPATAGEAVDRVRSFVLANAAYDAVPNQLDVVPESPLPQLEFYLARREI